MSSEKVDRLQTIRSQMEDACKKAGRSVSAVKLIGVSKKKPAADVADFLALGLSDFGENYVQEALEKISQVEALGKERNLTQPTWHFIGTLQSNKAKFLPGNFSLFHGLDSLSVAKKLNSAALAKGIVQNCLVEVNIADEASKGGLHPQIIPDFLLALNECKHLKILGFMCIPEAEGSSRKYFALLRQLLENTNQRAYYHHTLTELSMGMSYDFTDAILEGATMVRVGTALFGAR